jgi:transposase
MAALVAAHSNHQLKEFYQRLRAAGKPAKVALTAVMRKLIVLMNHILKNPNFALQN